jgi:hypothetical protein
VIAARFRAREIRPSTGAVPNFLCNWPNRHGVAAGQAGPSDREVACWRRSEGSHGYGWDKTTVEGVDAKRRSARPSRPIPTARMCRRVRPGCSPRASWASRRTTRSPRGAEAQADLCFAAIDAILQRPGSTAPIRCGSTPSSPTGRIWAATWRRGTAGARDGATSGLDARDRRGLHAAGVQGRGRGRRRPLARILRPQ